MTSFAVPRDGSPRRPSAEASLATGAAGLGLGLGLGLGRSEAPEAERSGARLQD